MANYQFYTCCNQDSGAEAKYVSLYNLAQVMPNPEEWVTVTSVGPANIGTTEAPDVYSLFYHPASCGSYPTTSAADLAEGILGRDSFSYTLTSETGTTFTGTAEVLVADCSIVRARPDSFRVEARASEDGEGFLIKYEDFTSNDTNGSFNGIARQPRLGRLASEYRGIIYYAPTCDQIAAAGGALTDDFEYKLIGPDIYVPDGPSIPGAETSGTITITLYGCSNMRAGDVFVDLCCGTDSNSYDIPFTDILANSVGSGLSLVSVGAPVSGSAVTSATAVQYTMPSCDGFARAAVPAVPGIPAIPGTPTIPAVPGSNPIVINATTEISIGSTGPVRNMVFPTINQSYRDLQDTNTLQVGDLLTLAITNNAIATGGNDSDIEDGWTTVADEVSLHWSFHYYYRFADQAYIDRQSAAGNQRAYPYFRNASDGPAQSGPNATRWEITLVTFRRPRGAPADFPLLQSINAQYRDVVDGQTALYFVQRSDVYVHANDPITVYGYPDTNSPETITILGVTVLLAYPFFTVRDLLNQIDSNLIGLGIKARILDVLGQDVTSQSNPDGYLTLVRATAFTQDELAQLPTRMFGTELDNATILVPVAGSMTTSFPPITGPARVTMDVAAYVQPGSVPQGTATKYEENFFRGFYNDLHWGRIEEALAGPYPFSVSMQDASTIVAYSLVLNSLFTPGEGGSSEIPGTPGVPAVPGTPAIPAIPVPTSGSPVVDHFTFTVQDETGARRTANVYVTVEPCFVPPPPIPPTANSVEITVCCPSDNVEVAISLADLMTYIGGTGAKIKSVSSGLFGAARLTDSGIVYTAQPCGFTYVPPPPVLVAVENTFTLVRPATVKAVNNLVVLRPTGPNLITYAELLGNDLGAGVRIVSFTAPRYGQLVDAPDRNGLSYTRPSTPSPEDYFTYTIENASGQRSTATVTINIFIGPQ